MKTIAINGVVGKIEENETVVWDDGTVWSRFSFNTIINGKWNVSFGGNVGENVNVMLNSDGVTATVVFSNNSGDLVLRVMLVSLTLFSKVINTSQLDHSYARNISFQPEDETPYVDPFNSKVTTSHYTLRKISQAWIPGGQPSFFLNL